MFCRHEAITEHHRQAAGKLKRKIMREEENTNKSQKKVTYPINFAMAVCETESPEFVSPELLEAIERVEASLDERKKKFIMLRYKDGLSYAEIGRRSKLSSQYIRMVIYKALWKIRHTKEVWVLINPEEAADENKLPIECSGLTTLTIHALQRKGIYTVGDLYELDIYTARHKLGLSQKVTDEILEYKQANGYTQDPQRIENCGFDTRMTNTLLRAGIHTIDDLKNTDPSCIPRAAGLGQMTMDKIIAYQKANGYTPDPRRIENCGFTTRTKNCLLRAGIHTVDDLKNAAPCRIAGIRDIGEKSIKEIMKYKKTLCD